MISKAGYGHPFLPGYLWLFRRGPNDLLNPQSKISHNSLKMHMGHDTLKKKGGVFYFYFDFAACGILIP